MLDGEVDDGEDEALEDCCGVKSWIAVENPVEEPDDEYKASRKGYDCEYYYYDFFERG